MSTSLSAGAWRRVALWSIVAVAALFTYFYSQGRNIVGKPSEWTIKQAVERSLEKQVPTSVAKSLFPCRAVSVYRVRVLDVGGSTERDGAKAWAVRAYVMGRMESQQGFRTATDDFGGEGTWIVSRDSLGEWGATAAQY